MVTKGTNYLPARAPGGTSPTRPVVAGARVPGLTSTAPAPAKASAKKKKAPGAAPNVTKKTKAAKKKKVKTSGLRTVDYQDLAPGVRVTQTPGM